MKIIPSLLVISFLLPLGFAEAEGGKKKHEAHQGPCAQIVQACRAAGFKKGKLEPKRLYKHCVEPLLSGQSVEGVSVSADVIEACRAKKGVAKSEAQE